MHRLAVTRIADYEEASTLFLLCPIKIHMVIDVILNVPPVAERAVVDMLVDEVPRVKVRLISHGVYSNA
jgi:hypothetical protein